MSQQTARLSGKPPPDDSGSHRQLEELSATVAQNRVDIEALQAKVEEATDRADASDERADGHTTRMDTLETRIDVDREVIAQLQADGLLSEEHAAHLEQALRSSRKIGAAIGLVMADRKVNEAAAVSILSRASQGANRKPTVVALEVVRKGDAGGLPTA